jgi:intracellular sulfur oxidation DsrE/DsrF family protein
MIRAIFALSFGGGRVSKLALSFVLVIAMTSATPAKPVDWPAPTAVAIPQADGFVAIPGAAVAPQKNRVYRALFDATRAAAKPGELVPAINMVGSELNGLATLGTPVRNAKFVVVFHGDAIDGILEDAHYRRKFGVANPNLPVLASLEKAGVELFVCGQNLAFAGIDPRTLTSHVKVASDALLVLMSYQNDGYALLSY